MTFYSPDPPRGKPPKRIRCIKCGQESCGYYYCFACRRVHAERVRLYMRCRRQDPKFRAAENKRTKLRMYRLRERQRQVDADVERAAHLANIDRGQVERDHETDGETSLFDATELDQVGGRL